MARPPLRLCSRRRSRRAICRCPPECNGWRAPSVFIDEPQTLGGCMNIDQQKLEAFMGKMIGHMTGGMVCYAIWLGDELGFYRALAGAGPVTSDSLADKTKCNRRLVREWLDGQAA